MKLVFANSLLALTLLGCGITRVEVRGDSLGGLPPFDAVIVPGCPSEDDGSLSRCQMARALWASKLWDRGWARNFITSGSDVYSPYFESEALAAALAALGVPAEHIFLESDALHTDENIYYSLRIARSLGFRRLAVASDGATMGCKMLLDWGQPCRSFTVDRDWVRTRHRAVPGVLEKIRSTRVTDWVPKLEREREISRRTGRHRPPSYLLYMGLAIMHLNGETWVPPGTPSRIPLITWAARRAALP